MKINLSIARKHLTKEQYVLLLTESNTCLYTCSKHVYKKDKQKAYRLLTEHMTRPQALSYAIYAAELSLPHVAKTDKEVALNAINAAKAVLKNNTEKNRNAAYAAAYAADAADAAYAAYSAANAAYAAVHAAYSAAYAADAAAYAAYTAAYAANATKQLLDKAREILG